MATRRHRRWARCHRQLRRRCGPLDRSLRLPGSQPRACLWYRGLVQLGLCCPQFLAQLRPRGRLRLPERSPSLLACSVQDLAGGHCLAGQRRASREALLTGEWPHVHHTSAVSICITIPSLPPLPSPTRRYVYIYIRMKLDIDIHVLKGFEIQCCCVHV